MHKKSAIWYFGQPKIIDKSCMGISIKQQNISIVNSIFFLGVKNDNKLTRKEHVHYLPCQIYKAIGAMNRITKIVPLNILIYCNMMWGDCYKTHCSRIAILQKPALRIIFNKLPFSHTAPVSKKHIMY